MTVDPTIAARTQLLAAFERDGMPVREAEARADAILDKPAVIDGLALWATTRPDTARRTERNRAIRALVARGESPASIATRLGVTAAVVWHTTREER